MHPRRAGIPFVAAACLTGCLVTFEDYPVGQEDAGNLPIGGASGASGWSGVGGAAGSAGSGGVGGGGTGGAAGAAGSPGCPNGLMPISDDFNDGNLTDDLKWNKINNGVSLAEYQGSLQLGWPGIVSSPLYGAIESSQSFDMTDCAAHVQVIQVASTTTLAYTRFALRRSPTDYLEIAEKNGYIYATSVVGGNSTDHAIVAYDTSIHRWWRLKHEAGSFHWQTSNDGVLFSDLAAVLDLIPMDSMTLVIGGGSEGAESSAPGVAKLDQVNLPP